MWGVLERQVRGEGDWRLPGGKSTHTGESWKMGRNNVFLTLGSRPRGGMPSVFWLFLSFTQFLA